MTGPFVSSGHGALVVTVQTVERFVVCELDGELDRRTAAILLDAMDWLRRGRVDSVVLDCRSLTFVDAGGLTALLRARKAAAEAGADLTLAAPSAMLTRILRATALTEVLPPTGPALLAAIERPRAVVHRLPVC